MKSLVFVLGLSISSLAFGLNPDPIDGVLPASSCKPIAGETKSLLDITNQAIKRVMSKSKDPGSLSNYKSDSCPDEDISDKYDVGTCEDNTSSFTQPGSEGYFGQEGKCGQTLVSNMLNMHCGLNLTPNESDYYVRDYSFGVASSTLASGLNDLFGDYKSSCPRSSWKVTNASSEREFLIEITNALSVKHSGNQVKRKRENGRTETRSPVGILIRNPGGQYLHWVTIVDVDFSGGKCAMIFNTWKKQYRAPCSDVAAWSRGVQDSYPILDKYTIVHLE